MDGLTDYPFIKLFFLAWGVGMFFRLGWRFADHIELACSQFREGFRKAYAEKSR